MRVSDFVDDSSTGPVLVDLQQFCKMAPKSSNKTIKDYGYVSQYSSNYKWTIDDIFTIFSRDKKTSLVSPMFSTDNNFKHRWALQLLINNSTDKSDFKVRLISYNNAYVTFDSFLFYVYQNEDRLIRREMKKVEFVSLNSFNGFRFTRKQIKTLKNSVTLNTKLSIYCRLSNPQSTNSADFYDLPLKILDDFESLYLNKQHCDMKLVASGNEFPVHKAILTARSSVFSAMFEHNMKEKNDGIAVIEGIKPEVLQELLRFIYIGKVEKFDVFYKDLLVAADMYAIEGLKNVCLNHMFKTINVENAMEYLIFADKYAVDKLKLLTMDFIVKNAYDVVKTKSYKKLKMLEASVAVELFKRLAFTRSS